MQKTRQKILEYLKEHDEATVDELSIALDNLTAVTVRHHLDVLRDEGFVDEPEILHRNSPGRPKYVYKLTSRANAFFPNNFETITRHMLGEIKSSLDDEQINVIFDGIANRMAADFPEPEHVNGFEDRLKDVVVHLSKHGYDAYYEQQGENFILHASNCPYSGVAEEHEELCVLDMRYISNLLGTVPRQIHSRRAGDDSCAYLIKTPAHTTAS